VGPTNSLVKQLEKARFERALEIIDSLVEHRALLTTGELGRVNQVITGKDEDPWRQQPTTLHHSSGRTFSFSLVADPRILARDKLHQATERCLSEKPDDVIEAATELYSSLVLSHVFTDGNRRTAAAAAHYFFARYGIPLSGTAIHELGMGDLRDPAQVQALRDTIRQMALFAMRRQ
jgi:prophage maintenance system killer protein